MRHYITMAIFLFSSFMMMSTSSPRHRVADETSLGIRQETASKIGSADEADLDWKEDEVCRLVFFAVLKGLYEDGVADDIVDNVIGPKSDLEDAGLTRKRMRISFVMDCPLCQPTFEAWLTYQNRPKFSDGSNASTFGKGLDADLRSQLMSKESQTRLQGLKVPVQRWILAGLKSRNMSNAQFEAWSKKTSQRFTQGKNKLIGLMQNDEHYAGWSPYWGCAACNAARDANQENGKLVRKQSESKE